MSTNNNNNNSAAATHINPFYIDPGELELEWEGDYENGEDEYEAEGLLNPSSTSSTSRQSSAVASKKKSATASFGNSKRHKPQLPHMRGLSRGQKRWICILVFFVLVIFFFLSSSDSKRTSNNSGSIHDGDDDSNHNNNNNNNNDSNGEIDYFQKDNTSHDENSNAAAAATMNDDDTSSSADDSSPSAASSRSKRSRPSSPGGGGGGTNNDNGGETPAEALSNVHRVVLLGERQTGVDAFKKHWSSCFPTRNFTTTLTRKTTWFQNLTHPVSLASQEKILFVLLVRNPYTWVEAMRGHPLHMSSHVNQTTGKALPWKDFVTKSWSPFYPDTTKDETTKTCQLGFAPNAVMPCRPGSADPPDVYELRPARGPEHSRGFDMDAYKANEISISDLAYTSILDLRTNKLKHFVYDLPRAYQGFGLIATPLQTSSSSSTTSKTSLIDNNVLIIHYEDDLVVSMQKLEQVTGWLPVEHCRQAQRLPPSIALENLDPEYIQFLSSSGDPYYHGGLDWELEAQLGYQKVV